MNFAAAFKAEIVRLARKELRAELESLRKASAQYRSDIAALKRKIADLEKGARNAAAESRRQASAGQEDASARRFSARSVAAQRKRLGLSAAEFGALVGVSGQTVYHWEQGKAKPREAQLASFHAVKEIGRREAQRRLAQ